MNSLKIPQENIISYSYLYNIENTLRELIIKSLSNVDGAHWYKRRLPGDVLQKYRNGIQYERSLKWYKLIPHHPIYYIDFPDLRKIIERKDNWIGVFKNIFLRKDFISSIFTELEFIRNKVAHNRKATEQDTNNLETVNAKLIKCIGENEYNELSSKITYLTDIPNRLVELEDECENTFLKCIKFEPIEKLEVWISRQNEWWFDESYLGYSLENISDYFKTIEEYSKLKRTRGSGHKIEAWVESRRIQYKYNKAQTEFSALMGVTQGGF